jgi:hypothetical protein
VEVNRAAMACYLELRVCSDGFELLCRSLTPRSVSTVNDEYYALRSGEVMSPVRP